MVGTEGRGGIRSDLPLAGQWFLFILANVIVPPVVVAQVFHLGTLATAQLEQRTLIATGLVSLAQSLWGHRRSIVEGPSGLWWSVFLALGLASAGRPQELGMVLASLRGGLLAAGVVLVLLGFVGGVARIQRWFTPAVTGVYLLLLSIQLGSVFLRGVLGSVAGPVDGPIALTDLALLAGVLWFTVRGPVRWRPYSILVGLAVGWGLFILTGWAPAPAASTGPLSPFATGWGLVFSPSVVLLCIVTGLINLTNTVASVDAMGYSLAALDVPTAEDRAIYDRSSILSGAGNLLAGLWSVIGMISFSTSASMVQIAGTDSRRAFQWAASAMVVLGSIPAVARLMASLPPAVGDTVLLVAYAQMALLGFQALERSVLSSANIYRAGLPFLVGVGLMTLPATTFATVPTMLRALISNGLIVGVLMALVLDHLPWWKLATRGPGESPS